MSVCCVSFRLRANSLPDDWQVGQPGHAIEGVALVVADEPGQHVRLAVLEPDHRVDESDCAKVGRPPKPTPETALTSTFRASDTSSLWCIRGVMSMLTPMFS